jgi:four helix bundle protein
VVAVYSATSNFPDAERYGLTCQLRRAVMSIPTNIAEGCGRNRDGEFARFIGIALGSANELDYLLAVSRDLGFIDQAGHESCSTALASIRNRLATLQRRLRSSVPIAPSR